MCIRFCWSVFSISAFALLLCQVTYGSDDPGDEDNLLACLDGGVCSAVHLNKWGIQRQKLCRCKGQNWCPSTFDLDDGKTVSHAFTQYKYCSRAPQLHPCKANEVMYTYSEGSKDGTTLFRDHRINCLCPAKYIQEYAESEEIPLKDGTLVWMSKSRCKKPDTCKADDDCMTISDNRRFKMIARRCSCPRNMYCPTNLAMSARNITFDNGVAYLMKCI